MPQCLIRKKPYNKAHTLNYQREEESINALNSKLESPVKSNQSLNHDSSLSNQHKSPHLNAQQKH